MSKKPAVEPTAPQVQAEEKAQWEAPVLRHVGHLGDVLLTTSKTGLSEHDPGIETYKPHGQDH